MTTKRIYHAPADAELLDSIRAAVTPILTKSRLTVGESQLARFIAAAASLVRYEQFLRANWIASSDAAKRKELTDYRDKIIAFDRATQEQQNRSLTRQTEHADLDAEGWRQFDLDFAFDAAYHEALSGLRKMRRILDEEIDRLAPQSGKRASTSADFPAKVRALYEQHITKATRAWTGCFAKVLHEIVRIADPECAPTDRRALVARAFPKLAKR